MGKINFCLFAVLMALVVTGCCYDPKEYASEKPVDFVYVNKSDYKINALLLNHITESYDTLLDKTTINLEPGEQVTIVTDEPVDGYDLFCQYVVIFNDSDFFCCRCRPRLGDWDDDIPMYPQCYKILPGTNENGHAVYEFTFTNVHYDSVNENRWVSDIIVTDENGERYFKDWERYDDNMNVGMGVMIDGLVWSPFDYDTKVDKLQGHFHSVNFEDAQKSCPKNWRAPTADEFKLLSSNHSKWGEGKGKPTYYVDNDKTEDGLWFSGLNAFSDEVPSVFLYSRDLWSDNFLKVGKYWSSTKASDGKALAFRFDSRGKIGLVQEDESEYCMLRCVKSNRRKY